MKRFPYCVKQGFNYIYAMRPIFIFYSVGLFLCGIILVGCNSNSGEASEQKETQEAIREVQISQSEIEALDFEDYALSDATQRAVADWTGFQEVAASVEYLKTGDFTFFRSEIDEIKKVMESCRFTVTEAFFTEQIMSRLTVVETRFLKLQNDLTLDNIPKKEQLNSIKEVMVAWSNLVYVMNKKFEFEATDAQRPEE
jgi:hypothetical protein